MGLTYEELSKIIHSDGAWLVLLAYAFRSVVDAVLAGIWEGLGLDAHLKTIKEATRDGVAAALKCSCCEGGGKAAVPPAESPADNKPTPEERKRKDEEEEAQIKSLVSPAAAPEREWRAVTTYDAMADGQQVSWEQALAMSRRGACRGVAEATVRFLLWHALQPPSTSRRSSSSGASSASGSGSLAARWPCARRSTWRRRSRAPCGRRPSS